MPTKSGGPDRSLSSPLSLRCCLPALAIIALAMIAAGCSGETTASWPPPRQPTQVRGERIAASATMEHYGSCGFVCHCSGFSDGLSDILHFGCGTQLGVAACDAQPVVTIPARLALADTLCNQRVLVCLAGTSSCVEATVMDTGPRNWEGNTFLFNALGRHPRDGTWVQRNGACLEGEFAGNTGHCCKSGSGQTTVDLYRAPTGPVHTAQACGDVAHEGYACVGSTLRRCKGRLDGVDQWEEASCEASSPCTGGLSDPAHPPAGCCAASDDPFHLICHDPLTGDYWLAPQASLLDGQACQRHLECLSAICGCSAASEATSVCQAAGSSWLACNGATCQRDAQCASGRCACEASRLDRPICMPASATASPCWLADGAPCTPDDTCLSGGACGCSGQSPGQPICLLPGTVPRRCSGEICSPVSPPCAGGCACPADAQLIHLTGTCQSGATTCNWGGVSPQTCASGADCSAWGGRCGCIDGQYRCLPLAAIATENCTILPRSSIREPCAHHDECKSGVCGGCWIATGSQQINAWKVCLPSALHGNTAPGACGQPGHRCDPSLPTPQCLSGSCACFDPSGNPICC